MRCVLAAVSAKVTFVCTPQIVFKMGVTEPLPEPESLAIEEIAV
jgi:hypothetical protein